MISGMPRLPGADPLLTLAVILVAGTMLGWLAQRIRLPAVTGQIVAGILIGPAALALFDTESVEGLQPLTHFALALIGVTVGAHLNLRRLRNAGRRLFWLLIAEENGAEVAALLEKVGRRLSRTERRMAREEAAKGTHYPLDWR